MKKELQMEQEKFEFITDSTTFDRPKAYKANTYKFDYPNIIGIKSGKHGIPKKATKGSAGFDLRADLLVDNITINPGESCLVNTGTSLELPEGTCAMVLPRSGLALKKSITIPNSPGLIDSDYRGDICVILRNEGTEPFVVEDGDRIAQLIIVSFISPSWISVDELSQTSRNTGGFGSTGV